MENIIEEYNALDSTTANSIKKLRTNIQFASISHEIKSMVITSVIPNEGKSTVASFLAMSMAETGKRTLIVESDFWHTTLRKRFQIPKTNGVLSYLSGQTSLDQTIVESGFNNLWFLDAESRIPNPVEIIGSQKFEEFMCELREKYDIIIYDTPPLGTFIDAALFASHADGTMLLIKPGVVDKKMFRKAVEQLEKANATILGVVFNGIDKLDTGYYGGYYGKYYKKKYGNDSDSK